PCKSGAIPALHVPPHGTGRATILAFRTTTGSVAYVLTQAAWSYRHRPRVSAVNQQASQYLVARARPEKSLIIHCLAWHTATCRSPVCRHSHAVPPFPMEFSMCIRLRRAGALLAAVAVAACSPSGEDASAGNPKTAGSAVAAATFTADYFHGDWCERYTPPHDPDDPIPTEDTEEEMVNLTFDPDGTFRIGRSAANVRPQGQWTLENGLLLMPANSVASRVTPEQVSADEFRFRSFGVEFRVT